MTHDTTATTHPKHWFFKNEASNFFYAHLFGSIFPFIGTGILAIGINYFFNSVPFIVYLIIFTVLEAYMYSVVEETKTTIPLFHYDPITVNGAFRGQFAPPGTYRKFWPYDLFSEERVSIEPSTFETLEIKTMSKENIELVGGKTLVSYIVDLSEGRRYTKKTKENFEKVLEGKIKQSLITLVNNSIFSENKDTDDKKDNIRKNLKEIARNLKEATLSEFKSIRDLCIDSGIIIESITIENFVPKNTKDTSALAQENRQIQENKALLEKANNFSIMVKNYRVDHPEASEKEAQEIIAAVTGYIPTQSIKTDGGGGSDGGGVTPIIILTATPTTK